MLRNSLILLIVFVVLSPAYSAPVICISPKNKLIIRDDKCRANDKPATIDNLGTAGAQGIQGPQGPQGPKGNTGANGTNGISGRELQEDTDNNIVIAAGATYGNFVTCTGVKKPLGGGCESSNSDVVVYYSQPGETQSFYSWFCGYKNTASSSRTVTVTAHAVCAFAS
jgi:hypothetical protein